MGAQNTPALTQSSARTLASCEDFEVQCIELFGDLVRILGLPRSIGQIYGLLFASPVPLGFTDMVQRLGMSKGSASQGLRLLRSLGAIHEAEASGKPGEGQRSVRYRPELSLRRLVGDLLRKRVAPMTTKGSGRLKELRQIARKVAPEAGFYLERVEQLEAWQQRLKFVLPALNVLMGSRSEK